jgi:plastocyanin
MPAINIIRLDGRVTFDPPVLEGAALGDRVFWRNMDPEEHHWITLKGKPDDFWFRFPLSPYAPGEPPDTSREVVLQTPASIVYVCSIHGEEGEIHFTPHAL